MPKITGVALIFTAENTMVLMWLLIIVVRLTVCIKV